jgi:hypothetical protein
MDAKEIKQLCYIRSRGRPGDCWHRKSQGERQVSPFIRTKAAEVGRARPNGNVAAGWFTRKGTRTVAFLGLFWLSATAAAPTTVPNPDARLLGMKRSAVESKLGRAVLVDVNVEPAVAFYCVTGTYEPVIYDHDGHWFRGKRTPLGDNSAGPCGKHAENLVVMYDTEDRAIAAGYLTVHANTYDRGWSDSLDRLILGRREGELYRGATPVELPGVTAENGPHAIRLATGETSVVFETAGDVATMGRMAIVLFADQHDVTNGWLKLLNDPTLWGR